MAVCGGLVLVGCAGEKIPSATVAGFDPDTDRPYVQRDGSNAVANLKSLVWTDDAVAAETNNDPFTISMDIDGFDGSGVGAPRALSLEFTDSRRLLNLLAGDNAGMKGLRHSETSQYDADGNLVAYTKTLEIDEATLSASEAINAQAAAVLAAGQAFAVATEAQKQTIIETVSVQAAAGVDFGAAFIEAVSETLGPGVLLP
jgi:hypothetical protein